jgi:hypothetical protein
MKKIKTLLVIFFSFIIPGCSSNNIEYYSHKKHTVDLKSFFSGNIEGWGAIFDYSGRQIRSFKVVIKGTWNNKEGQLQEWFEFDDGEKNKRTWDIVFQDSQIFIGKAHDVMGEAQGRQNGSAVNINYILQVPYKNYVINLKMDDWMYLVENDLILNRTAMKKFGFKVGEIVLFMKKIK